MSDNKHKIEDPEQENLNMENAESELNNAEADTENSSAEQEELSEFDQLAKQLEDANQQVEKEKKEYLFLMAEFDNFRKRTVKEKSDIIRNAAENAMKGLLPIVDDFERALNAVKDSSDSESAKEGMTLIYNKLIKYLEQNGVKPIESTGADFDPEFHEAIAMVPTDDESLKGKVIDTPTKGYTINDKVLRYAKVAVGQ